MFVCSCNKDTLYIFGKAAAVNRGKKSLKNAKCEACKTPNYFQIGEPYAVIKFEKDL